MKCWHLVAYKLYMYNIIPKVTTNNLYKEMQSETREQWNWNSKNKVSKSQMVMYKIIKEASNQWSKTFVNWKKKEKNYN